MIDANREALCAKALQALAIDAKVWGEAVSSRPIRLVGAPTPWDVTIATVTDSTALIPAFGADFKTTRALTLTVDCLVDVKLKEYESLELEVEVGVPLDFAHFRQVGGKGKILATDSSKDGYVISMIMTENLRHYPYCDPDWQAAAAHYGKEHLVQSLTAGLEGEKKALVRVSSLSTCAVKPLNSLTMHQSAKGITAHFLVMGVAFEADCDGDESLTTVPAQPISLRANILDGGVSADGLTPSASLGGIKIKLLGGGDSRVKNGVWYPPHMVAAIRAEERAAKSGGAGGSGPGGGGSGAAWASRKTTRRAEQRQTAAAQQRAAQHSRARFGTDGNESDGAMSDVRRQMASSSVGSTSGADPAAQDESLL